MAATCLSDRTRRLAVGAVALACAVSVSACGGTDDTLANYPDDFYGPPITADEAVDLATAVTPGEVVEVREDVDRGVRVFDVVIDTDEGILVATQVEANTGQVLKSEQLLPDGRVPNDAGLVVTP